MTLSTSFLPNNATINRWNGIMEEGHNSHTVLCVDDERNVLNSLKRLLRNEGYGLLTASSGASGLSILKENDVHLVVADQRMPGMGGTEFLARVKAEHPDVMQIILTGYTDVDSITESINKGHIYKFLLKPWNDQNLKLEIKQALEQYGLVQANRELNEKVAQQNTELKRINENLEDLVKERTEEIKIQNHALELSRVILQDLPVPTIGVSTEGTIVLINREAQCLSFDSRCIEVGRGLKEYFSNEVSKVMIKALETKMCQVIKEYHVSRLTFDIDCVPLSGRFQGKGVVLVLRYIRRQGGK